MHPNDSKRHYGFFSAHYEYRCHELNKIERNRLAAELEESRRCLREACNRLATISETNPEIDMSDLPRWRKVAGSTANPSSTLEGIDHA